jgi:cation:H+ antiporter
MLQMVQAFLAVILLFVSLFLDSYISRIDGFVLLTGYPIMLLWLFRALSEGPIQSEYDTKFGADFSTGSSLLNLGVGTAIYILALGLFEWGTESIWNPALGAADFNYEVFMPILTSLPELMVCVVSALHRQYDFAAGVIIGASVTNISVVVAIVAILKPAAVPLGSLSIHFLVMSVFAGVLLAMIYEPGAGEVKIRKVEGLMLMLAFFAYFAQVLYFS